MTEPTIETLTAENEKLKAEVSSLKAEVKKLAPFKAKADAEKKLKTKKVKMIKKLQGGDVMEFEATGEDVPNMLKNGWIEDKR